MISRKIRCYANTAFYIYQDWLKSQVENDEIKKVFEAKKRQVKAIKVIYDYKSSAPGYGEFLNIIFLCRVLARIGFSVKLLIITGDLREDWSCYSEDAIRELIREHLDLVNYLTLNFNVQTTILTQFDKNLFNNTNEHVLFLNKVEKRLPWYVYSFNLINKLFKRIGYESGKDVLLNHNDLVTKKLKKDIPKSYIALGCRHSSSWAKNRNLSEQEFLNVYKYLDSKFNNIQKMVISGGEGCDFFKDYAVKKGLNLDFSNNYAENYLECGKLVLNSQFFYQYKGGGIANFAIFSNLAYEIRCNPVHERYWKKKHADCLAKKKPSFYNPQQD